MIKTLAMIVTIASMLLGGEVDILIAIATHAQAHDIPIVRAFRQVYAESSLDPDATSPSGECHGLLQLHEEFWSDAGDLYDVNTNLDTGFGFMARLLEYYEGDYRKALGAFNWGPGNLDRCIEEYGDDWFGEIPGETQRYVKWIMKGGDMR